MDKKPLWWDYFPSAKQHQAICAGYTAGVAKDSPVKGYPYQMMIFDGNRLVETTNHNDLVSAKRWFRDFLQSKGIKPESQTRTKRLIN